MAVATAPDSHALRPISEHARSVSSTVANSSMRLASAVRCIVSASIRPPSGARRAKVAIASIAEAAEVSPSSVYRYFGTKEQVVLRDEYEPEFFEAVEAELVSHPPVAALRYALARIMTDYFSRDDDLAQRRTRYFLEEPGLRAAWTEQTDQFSRAVAEALARVTGRRADELEVQVIGSALVWSMVAAIRHWHAGGYTTPLEEEFNQALAVVENGLQLGAPHGSQPPGAARPRMKG
jgi:AcrR family transcriptional regulator